jgi:predicted lipid-binding transport protein (Tim44 family)
MQYRIGPPPLNPVTRLLAGVAAAIALVGAFFFGFIILALAIVAGLVLWLVIWVRLWWFRRKLAAQADSGHAETMGKPSTPEQEKGDVIDAEYEGISREQDSDQG